METFFVEMEAGLMEIVRSLNRNWIFYTYFSLYRPIHPGGKSGRGEMSGYHKISAINAVVPRKCAVVEKG